MDKTIAAIEIKNSNFKLLIGYLYDNKVNVLYKNTYPLTVSNKDGDIYDLSSLSEDLKNIKTISDPKKRLRIDIPEVVLVVPPFGLEVYQNTKTTNTVSSDSKVSKIDISNIHSMFKKSRIPNETSMIVDIVPYAFTLDNNRVFDNPPLNEVSSSLTLSAHIFAMPQRIIQSFRKAIEDSGIICKRVVISPLGVNSLLNLNKFNTKNPYVLVDFNSDNTVLSFFGDNKLYISNYFSLGGFDLTKTIANIFEISIDKAEEIKRTYGLDLRETSFNAPILSVIGSDEIKRKHDVNELREIIKKWLEDWNILFSNCLNTLLKEYGDLASNIPLVFVGDSTKLNNFYEFIKAYHPNNDIKIYCNDSIGALNPGDMNLLGGISFVSQYKGSLEDNSKIDISKVSRRREKEVYSEEIDEL